MNNLEQAAKNIFFEYACNHFFMGHDGVLEEYRKYSISTETEILWRQEYISFWESQLSTNSLTALFHLRDAHALEALADIIRIANQGDDYSRFWFADVLWELAGTMGCPPTVRKNAIDTAFEIWEALLQNSITLTDEHHMAITPQMMEALEATNPEEYILHYTQQKMATARKMIR